MKSVFGKTLGVIALIVIIVLAMIVIVSAGIWAINTLFGAGIAYTAKNIFAGWLLILVMNLSSASNTNK